MARYFCPLCSLPLTVFGGETPPALCQRCTDAAAETATHCRAPGCHDKLREGTKNHRHGFCPTHFSEAFACQYGRSKRCEYRAAADSPGRFCVMHSVKASNDAEKQGRIKTPLGRAI